MEAELVRTMFRAQEDSRVRVSVYVVAALSVRSCLQACHFGTLVLVLPHLQQVQTLAGARVQAKSRMAVEATGFRATPVCR